MPQTRQTTNNISDQKLVRCSSIYLSFLGDAFWATALQFFLDTKLGKTPGVLTRVSLYSSEGASRRV